MHICLTANTDWYLYNFRLDLARALVREGQRVSMLCPPGAYVARLREAGFEVLTFTAPARGFSLAANLRALREITAAYRQLKPDLVHLFTPVCVLLGGIAARRCGVRYQVAALTGLGHVFTSPSLKARLARPGLRRLFRGLLTRPGTAVIFQNSADRDELIAAGVVRAADAHLVRGSGVDVERFQPRAAAEHVSAETSVAGKPVVIGFASRLLREKGIDELVAAFAQVRQQCPHAELWIAGEVYTPNPSSLTAGAAAALATRPGVRLLGHVEDMPGLLAQLHIMALPSWREGTPKVLLEAAACGLPIVATDIPGCRGVVGEGASGYLVPVRDVGALAAALQKLCADAGLRQRLGAQGRAIVVQGFSREMVVRATLQVYAGLCPSAGL